MSDPRIMYLEQEVQKIRQLTVINNPPPPASARIWSSCLFLQLRLYAFVTLPRRLFRNNFVISAVHYVLYLCKIFIDSMEIRRRFDSFRFVRLFFPFQPFVFRRRGGGRRRSSFKTKTVRNRCREEMILGNFEK